MADPAQVLPIDNQATDPTPAPDGMDKFAQYLAAEFNDIDARLDALKPAEPLAPIVNVQSAVPAIQVMPAELPGTVVNVETVAPVINVMPAAAPSFNFHADSASVGFDISLVSDQLAAMNSAHADTNESMAMINNSLVEQTGAINLMVAAITAQSEAIAALARALLAPRKIINGPDGKPIGVKTGD